MQDFFDGVFDDLNVDNILHRFTDPAANTVTFLFIALGCHVNNCSCILNVFFGAFITIIVPRAMPLPRSFLSMTFQIC